MSMLKKLYRIIIGRHERAVLIFRLSHYFRKVKPIADTFWALNLMLHSLEINKNARIGKNFTIGHSVGIVIGHGVEIGDNVTIFQNVTLGSKVDEKTGELHYPIIKNNVTIYPGSVIVGNVTIEENSVIGANSFVSQNIPENTIVAGNPVKIIKKIGVK